MQSTPFPANYVFALYTRGMANSRLTKSDAAQAIKALKAAGGVAAEAARRLKIPINTFKGRIDAAIGRFGMERPAPSKFIKPQLAEPATLAHLRKIAQLEQHRERLPRAARRDGERASLCSRAPRNYPRMCG